MIVFFGGEAALRGTHSQAALGNDRGEVAKRRLARRIPKRRLGTTGRGRLGTTGWGRYNLRMGNDGNVVAIVAAGGKGVRAECGRPKQFAMLSRVSVLGRAVAPFAQCAEVSSVVVAVNPEWVREAETILSSSARKGDCGFVRVLGVGGESRGRTVAAALNEGCRENDWALVHDAARPFLSAEALLRVIVAARGNGVGAAPVLPVSEALKKVDEDGSVVGRVERAGLFLAQTPQMFRAGLLKKALEQTPDAEDECEAMVNAGFRFATVDGDPRNVKLTFPADFALAEALCACESATEAAAATETEAA